MQMKVYKHAGDAYAQYLGDEVWAAYDLIRGMNEWEVRVYTTPASLTAMNMGSAPQTVWLPAGTEDMRVPVDSIHEQVYGILMTLEVARVSAE